MCNCLDDFRPNLPKNNGRFHRKENTNFPKRRLVRSKNVCLNSALLFPLAVTTEIVSSPSLYLYLEKYVFFVQMQSRVSAALVFEGYVRYFGSLHPAFGMSCDIEYLEETAFDFFWKRGLRRFVLCAVVWMIFVQTFRKIMGDFTGRKTQTFQNDV